MNDVTTSAAEWQAKREVVRLTSLLYGREDIGECSWTGATDNTDLGVRSIDAEERDW